MNVKQIMTNNHKKERSRVKEKLAYDVPRCIQAYLAELAVREQRNLNIAHNDSAFRRRRTHSVSASRICF